MEELKKITININANISKELAEKCTEIFQTYLRENPDKLEIVVRSLQMYRPPVWIDVEEVRNE